MSATVGTTRRPSIPDSSGAVALNVTDLTYGTHLLTLTATDSVGLTGTAAEGVVHQNPKKNLKIIIPL